MALDAALRASIAATTVAAVATESAAVTTSALATRAICTGTCDTVGRFLLHREADALVLASSTNLSLISETCTRPSW